MDSIVKKTNKVVQKQQFYQSLNGKELVFMRGRGKYYYYAYLGLFGAGLAGSLFQLSQYVRGKVKAGGA